MANKDFTVPDSRIIPALNVSEIYFSGNDI